jgi:hypothetical protein
VLQDFFSINASNVYLDGYYQSEKYFDKYRNELSKQFVPKYDMTTENIKILNQLKKTNSVAVHVRRGDFLKAKHDLNPRHYLLGENYDIDALKYVNCHIDNPVYYWFSDDIEWVKKQFGEQYNFQYISVKSDNPDIDELMLMKKCNHIIAANSTFSWWAAWLNDNTQALKIVPGRRYGNAEMIPNDWVRI